MDKITLIYITNEHNNWLDILEAKKRELETIAKGINAMAGEPAAHQDKLQSYISSIERMQQEIYDNLQDIARQAEINSGSIDVSMSRQHEDMKVKFVSVNASVDAYCREIGQTSNV